MIKKLFIAFIFIFSINVIANNSPILVTEATIVLNINQTKELYFSFAKGDEIQFDFEMVKGKHLKEIEVTSLPNTILFSEFKATNFSKKITVKNKGLFKFKFKSSSLTKRVCKVKIYRTPASEESKNFNTGWKWKTVKDTTYIPYTIDTIIGYNTLKEGTKNRKLIKTETVEDVVFEKSQRVHSFYNENKSKIYLKVDLPQPLLTDTKEEKILAWAYWIGVGKESQEAYKKNVATISEVADSIASKFKNPLANFAIGKASELITPKVGDDIFYSFITDFENAENFINGKPYTDFDKGKGIVAYGKNTNLTKGKFYIGLHNDNKIRGVDVTIKIVAIKEIKTFEIEETQKEKIEPKKVRLTKKQLKISERKIRVPIN